MIIIGEKINGAIPVVAKAIAERDAEFIRERAKAQIAAAQDEDYFEEPVPLYIDVCASTDPSVEVETLKWMIDEVQAAIKRIEDIVIPSDKFLGTVADNFEKAKELYDKGYNYIIMMSDSVDMAKEARSRVAKFRDYCEKGEN